MSNILIPRIFHFRHHNIARGLSQQYKVKNRDGALRDQSRESQTPFYRLFVQMDCQSIQISAPIASYLTLDYCYTNNCSEGDLQSY